jgi:hypothetical protein
MKVSYDQILILRSNLNVKLFAEEFNAGYSLTCSSSIIGLPIETFLPKLIDNGNGDGGTIVNPVLANFVANILPNCNTPISTSEVRFYTHDFADASTWNGKTCGDPAAFYVGGVMLHPLVGLWVNSTGAGMLQAYANPAATGYYQNPSVLYGALTHLITAQYDDVNFRWVDNLANSYLNDPTNHAYTNYCWLDQTPTVATASVAAAPAVWRDGTSNAIICQFDSTAGPDQITNSFVSNAWVTKKRGSWMGKDSNGTFTIDTTSSRWRIDPYDNTKVELRKVGLTTELTAELSQGSAFRWKPYGMPSAAQSAQLEAMGLPHAVAILPFEGPEYIYHTMSALRFGCNEYTQTTSVEPGCKTPTIGMAYNYTETVTPYLDALKKQRLDITLDNDLAINKSYMARGTFLAIQLTSF